MRSTDLFDSYLNNTLSEGERKGFEYELNTNPVTAKAFEEHRQLIAALRDLDARSNFRQKLQEIHQAEFGNDAKIIPVHAGQKAPPRLVRTVVAAALTSIVVVVSVVAVLSYSGYLLTRQSDEITDLNREVKQNKAYIEGVIDGIAESKNRTPVFAPANYEASAFALNNAGYVLTSYHSVKGADSVFIRNRETERSKAVVIACDPKLDLAILKVEDPEKIKKWNVPFALKEQPSDIGEKVFTLGYPRRDMVYGEGSLSSLSGHASNISADDTSLYQISIPVNPGNSGGPLLDDQGNIIGLVRSKESRSEGTGYALKSGEIIHYLKNSPDSLKREFFLGPKPKNRIKHLKRTEQIKRINPYVFNVLVYKK